MHAPTGSRGYKKHSGPAVTKEALLPTLFRGRFYSFRLYELITSDKASRPFAPLLDVFT